MPNVIALFKSLKGGWIQCYRIYIVKYEERRLVVNIYLKKRTTGNAVTVHINKLI